MDFDKSFILYQKRLVFWEGVCYPMHHIKMAMPLLLLKFTSQPYNAGWWWHYRKTHHYHHAHRHSPKPQEVEHYSLACSTTIEQASAHGPQNLIILAS